MKRLILAILFTQSINVFAQNTQLESYINDFFGDVRPLARKQALALVPTIVKLGDKYNIDPLLIAVIITQESSWRSGVVGAMGERGLMQLHGKPARKVNWGDKRSQIEAGVKYLAKLRVHCNRDMKQAINAYMTGQCQPIVEAARRRYNLYRKAKRRHK